MFETCSATLWLGFESAPTALRERPEEQPNSSRSTPEEGATLVRSKPEGQPNKARISVEEISCIVTLRPLLSQRFSSTRKAPL
ncbi:hypothetical protein [Sphingobacterium sp.]|uniref:hypothetical protein n=1 Tax=Sphingobacterium sp. TaxID=341027 RepID=UPI00289D8398|nr:hypothetical protein [Sphingobacterium sp.]